MENQQQQTTGASSSGRERCADLGDQIAEMLGLRPDTREHLRNARIEVLKAVRSVIDSRIERLSRTEPKGTKVTVE